MPEEFQSQITLGPGGVSVQLPVLRGWLRRFLRLVWFAPLHDRVEIRADHAEFDIAQDDHGEIYLRMRVTNYCTAAITVFDLDLAWISFNSTGLGTYQIHRAGAKYRVPGRSSTMIRYSLVISTNDIRAIIRQIDPPQSKYSTPRAWIRLMGSIEVKSWRGSGSIKFAQDEVPCALNIHHPGSVGEGA